MLKKLSIALLLTAAASSSLVANASDCYIKVCKDVQVCFWGCFTYERCELVRSGVKCPGDSIENP